MFRRAVVLVFGCRHEKEESARAHEAVALSRLNRIDPIFIFTGFKPRPLDYSYYVSRKTEIIWEYSSLDTQDNVKNSLELIKMLKLDWFDLYVISSWYHIPRIWLWLRREGVYLPKGRFWKSYDDIAVINVLVEPFALLAAFLQINRWPVITAIKRKIGYPV